MQALRCPSCNAPLKSNETKKCEYCGAILAFSSETSVVTTPQTMRCPKCSSENEEGRWFCKHCKSIFASNFSSEELERLMNEQKRLRFNQNERKSVIAQKVLMALSPSEYIYYVYHDGKRTLNEVVTDTRIIHYKLNKGIFSSSEEIWEVPYKEITSFDEGTELLGGWQRYNFNLNTYSGRKTISIFQDFEGFMQITEIIKELWSRYTTGKFDSEHILCFGEIIRE